MPEFDVEKQLSNFRAFTKWMALAVVILIALPTLLGIVLRPANSLYLGIQYNIDDHMVYSAWMRQAMEGRILFENRFTTDPQPGLTFHVYFLVLGWVARLVGIPISMFLARIGFTALSIILLGRLIEATTERVHHRKLALCLAVFGGGLGSVVWHNFGLAIVKPSAGPLAGWMLSRLPTDTWQPEGYFFYSALTNGLFMVSLCLILGTFLNVLQAKTSRKAVLRGALCFGVLMNIHSYDVLLITLVLIGLPFALGLNSSIDKSWVTRSILIGVGAIPAALWFVYVLKNDPVFQARAATLTYSPNFRQVLFGFAPILLFGLVAFPRLKGRPWPALMLVAICAALYVLAARPEALKDGYFLSPLGFCIVFVSVCGAIWFTFRNHPPEISVGFRLIVTWAMIGLFAAYFPALFQRKLMMMLGVPWGILAGVGISNLLENRDRGQRNLLATLLVIVCSATGIQWIQRELVLARNNVSNTTFHAVYQSADFVKVVEVLSPLGRKAVVASFPGTPSPRMDEQGNRVEDIYDTPIIPDLNPFFVGLAGSRAYAGHWSETPDYGKRRNQIVFALKSDDPASSLKSLGITHFVFYKSVSDIIPPFGRVLFDGTMLILIEL